eukprot:TRINITY_DN4163_c0_g1_i1.p1 TRINITY_DN4163_c0_g1~~TRINITY_DN4163_c0_g1_i1.p1  ORF type:complete len:258 (-),score=89.86 TRINITY_DN4163_c0_g1_i1:432-1205(-)
MTEKTVLVEFAKNLKWEDYIDNPTVYSSLEKIKEAVSGGKPTKGNEDVDMSGAKRVKLVVVGDGAVGKTSLLISYATGEFPTEYLPTVFENYTAQMKRENELILLHLWDTAGQEDYDRLRPLSYPGADVLLLCFSTISQSSFEAIREKWAPEVHHYVANIPHILVGTKIDLREAKAPDPNSGKFEPIMADQAQKMAEEISAVKYLEVSSKTGKGVSDVFNLAVDLVLKEREGNDSGSHSNNAPKGKKKKKDGACLLL